MTTTASVTSDLALASNWQPVPSLEYPGSDPSGELWERPPSDLKNIPDQLPSDRPKVIVVAGSIGASASWGAGLFDPLEDLVDPVRMDLTSGNCIPGLAVAARINKHWRRIMNAGVPSQKLFRPASKLPWWQRKNLDLAGTLHNDELARWLGDWLRWAGVETFRDLRYRPDEWHPEGVSHRVGISVVLWTTKLAFPKYSDEALQDPSLARKLFRQALFSRQFPWRQFKQVFIPDDIATEMPWLAGKLDDMPAAEVARISASLWPAFVPTVFQNPRTRQLVFMGDGGHINNQPSIFNNGQCPHLPMINPRLMQSNRDPDDAKQRLRDAKAMPYGHVIRFPRTGVRTLGVRDMTLAKRDRLYVAGVEQGRKRLPQRLTEYLQNFQCLCDANGNSGSENQGGPMVTRPVWVPKYHGFRLIATARDDRYRVIRGRGVRS